MTRTDAIKLFYRCKPAIFRAEVGKLRIHMYPLKRGGGFAWILRNDRANDFSDLDSCIQDGGVIHKSVTMQRAMNIAVSKLFSSFTAAERGGP